MSKWEMVRLGDVVTLLNGRAYKQTELLDKGTTPILRVGNFFSNRDWYYSDLQLDENKYCDKGDLLYAWSASFGPKIWDGPRAIYHYHIWKVVLGERVEKGFMYYLLQYSTKSIMNQGRGITMIHATKGGMEKMLIPLPPMETQKQIAKTLDTVSELLAMRKQQLVELDNLIKSTFYDMFGDLLINNMDWIRQSIVEVCSEIVDCVNKTAPILNAISPYKMIRTTNIKKGKVDTDNVKYVDEKTFHKWTRRSIPSRGDVLLTREAPIGEAGIIDSDDFLFLGQRIVSYRTDRVVMNPLYLLHLMQSEYFQNQIGRLARGSTVKHLSVPECKRFEVYVPPIELQNQFADIVTKIEEQKTLVKKAIDETQYLFDSLMSEYFD